MGFIVEYGVIKLIGVIGLHYLDLVNKRTSIGYYLAEDFQKKGIMTRCTKALIQYVYEEYDINRIEIQMSIKIRVFGIYSGITFLIV